MIISPSEYIQMMIKQKLGVLGCDEKKCKNKSYSIQRKINKNDFKELDILSLCKKHFKKQEKENSPLEETMNEENISNLEEGDKELLFKVIQQEKELLEIVDEAMKNIQASQNLS